MPARALRSGAVTALSPRLAAVAALLPAGAPFADIGTDHALLPVALVRSGRAPRCVATDLRPGPAARARREVAAAGLHDRIDVRVGRGLQPLRPGEVEAICIAGLGGARIASILAGPPSPDTLGVRWLALQPLEDAGALRRFVHRAGWTVWAEDLVEEDGHIYTVIGAQLGGGRPLPPAVEPPGVAFADVHNTAATGDAAAVVDAARVARMPPALVELLWDAGPLLWRAGHRLFGRWVGAEVDALRRAAAGAGAARGAAGRARAKELLERAQAWEELLAWGRR